jgi:hypothetical protein
MATVKTNDKGYEGHETLGKAPAVKKGTFQQVGEFVDTGSMTTTYNPKATSVNQKSGNSGGGEV